VTGASFRLPAQGICASRKRPGQSYRYWQITLADLGGTPLPFCGASGEGYEKVTFRKRRFLSIIGKNASIKRYCVGIEAGSCLQATVPSVRDGGTPKTPASDRPTRRAKGLPGKLPRVGPSILTRSCQAVVEDMVRICVLKQFKQIVFR
jgi:hypothetical protein